MTPDIRPFDSALGAEVRGVALSRRLDDEHFAANATIIETIAPVHVRG